MFINPFAFELFGVLFQQELFGAPIISLQVVTEHARENGFSCRPERRLLRQARQCRHANSSRLVLPG